MSAALVLPLVWAAVDNRPQPEPQPQPNLAFYRKYTVAMLRRYVRMSLEAGRTPSLLGQEMFRAKISHYRVDSFEDVVIFLHDIEHCLEQLTPQQQHVITRIALQEFTVEETAAAMHLNPRTIVSHYREALDRLTAIFLQVKLLEPQKSCQGGKTVEKSQTPHKHWRE